MRILEAAQIFCDGHVFTTKMAAHSSAALFVKSLRSVQDKCKQLCFIFKIET